MATTAQNARAAADGLHLYFNSKIDEVENTAREKEQNLRRLEAQRNDLNARVRLLRQELQLLQEPGSYVGEVVKALGKKKVLVKVNPEGKYIVDVDKDIDVAKCTPNTRVALRSDSYQLHKILPTKVDPLVSLMKVEKVPDSTHVCATAQTHILSEVLFKYIFGLFVSHPTRRQHIRQHVPFLTRLSLSLSPCFVCLFADTISWGGSTNKFARSKR